MIEECIKFPELNHEVCQLQPHEKVVAKFFESRGLDVERLCAAKFSGKAPDFRLTGKENFVCICEVKKPKSPMGNLTRKDREYLNRAEFEKLIEEARKQNVHPVVSFEQYLSYHNKTTYSDEERNTDLKEKDNAKKIKEWLRKSSVGKYPFAVTISRNDSFHWTEEELHDFANSLIDSLELIKSGQIPRYWSKDFHTINGHYRKVCKDGRCIQNQIQAVRRRGPLMVDVQFSLGTNWETIEGDAICRKAQRQIVDRLKYESEREKVVRLVVIFLEQNLLFEYFPKIDELEFDVSRRILSKFPEFSAVVFCENFDPHFSHANFLVFHTGNDNIPSLPRNIFDDGYSFQFPR